MPFGAEVFCTVGISVNSDEYRRRAQRGGQHEAIEEQMQGNNCFRDSVVAPWLHVTDGTSHEGRVLGSLRVQPALAAWAGKTAAACELAMLVGGVQRSPIEARSEGVGAGAGAYLFPPSTGLPGLRCASRTLPVVVIFSCDEPIALEEVLVAAAAVDMERTSRARRVELWAEQE
jgi:hypothetical protein